NLLNLSPLLFVKNLNMPPNRLNVSCACSSCKTLKIKCDYFESTISTAKCTQCTKRNAECIFSEGNKRGRKPKTQTNNRYQKNHRLMKSKNNTIHESHIDQTSDKRNNELICDLSQEEIRILSDMYSKEELPQKIAILGSITFHPCPSMKDPCHQCHMGCI
ncbi:4268_t:CDS:2, partial [Gigaspora rosea]